MDGLSQLIKNKKFGKAEALLRKMLASAPVDLYLLTQLANVLWNRHKDVVHLQDLLSSVF